MGAFGLLDDLGNPYQVPPEWLVESHPCVDIFQLYREGLLVRRASAVLEAGHGVSRLAAPEPGKISIDGTEVRVSWHTALPLPVFICPACQQTRYKLFNVGVPIYSSLPQPKTT